MTARYIGAGLKQVVHAIAATHTPSVVNPENDALSVAQLPQDTNALACNSDSRRNIPPVALFPNSADGAPIIPPRT